MRDPKAIAKLFSQYEREVRGLLDEVINLVYYMRGSIQYEQMLNRSFAERKIIGEFIEGRLEKESKNLHPVY